MILRLLVIALVCTLSEAAAAQGLSEAVEQAETLYREKKYTEAIDLLRIGIDNDKGEMSGLRISAHLWLARNYMHSWQREKAKQHYQKAWQLSKEYDNDSLQIQAGMSVVVMLGYDEKPDTAKQLITELLEYESLKHYERSNLYVELAGYYEDTEQIDSAILYASLAAEIDSVHQDSSSIPYTYYDLGNYYVANFQYKEGISKILHGLDYLRGDRDLFKKNTIELGLSNIYLQIGNATKAGELAAQVLTSAAAQQQQINLTIAYNALGNVEAYQEQYEDALRYYELSDSVNSAKSKNIWRGLRAKISIVEQKLNLNRQVSDADLAYINEVAADAQSGYLKNRIDFLKLRVAEYSTPQFMAEYDRLYVESGAAERLGLKRSLLKIKKEHLKKNGRYREALKVDDELDRLRKKITAQNNDYIIQDLEARHRKKEQEQQIRHLDEKNTVNERALEVQRNQLWGGAIALLMISLLSFFLLRLYQKVKSQKAVISKALSEKDILLREIHHRVKNNLQLVSSLLTLQGRSIDDETALQAINEGKSRVRSMALIHQNLYNKENLTGIGVKDYVEKLTRELFSTYRIDQDKISLMMDVEDLDLDVDTLVPLGLIINELITNSLKYAFPTGTTGTITVSLMESNETLTLMVADDGVGYDPTQIRDNSFGSTLITALVEQLEGTMHMATADGTSIEISFPHQ